MTIHHRAREIAGYINEKAAVLESMGRRDFAQELAALADDVDAGRRSDPPKVKPRKPVAECLFPERHIIWRTDLSNPKRPDGRSANRYKRVESYRSGMSVGEYLDENRNIGVEIFDLWWDERDGLIKVISPDAFSEMETT